MLTHLIIGMGIGIIGAVYKQPLWLVMVVSFSTSLIISWLGI